MMRACNGFVVGLALLILAGCPTAPPTLKQQIQGAALTVARYNLRTAALVDRGLITPEDGERRAAQARTARTGVDLANNTLIGCERTGDTTCSAAQTALAAAQSIMAQIEEYLLAKEKDAKK